MKRTLELRKIIAESLKDNSVQSAIAWAKARKELSNLENK